MGLKERREREKEARRKQILAAARKLLFKNGLQATSIQRIARTAELGVGTIYFYYQSKEEIFYALQEEGLQILHAQIDAIRRSPAPPDEQLYHTAATYYRFSEEYKDYFDIINYFLSTPSVILGSELKQRIDRKGGRILQLIEGAIQQGITEGAFRAMDAKKVALLFWGALHGMIQFKKLETTVLGGDAHQRMFSYAVNQFILGLGCADAP